MTSLLPDSARPVASSVARGRPAADHGHDLRHRRPLVPVAFLGGALAAASPLVVCLALGVTGWFLTDAGAHGAPRDALRVGALAWLLAHGSGLHLPGAAITIVPLGLTLLCAWSSWRVGLRVGDSISGHGPDLDRLADGERDLTVPFASGLYAAGYVVTAMVTLTAATSAGDNLSGSHVVAWCLLIAGVVGGAAIAVGSGRAAVWTALLPATLIAGVAVARRVLIWWLAVSAATFAISFVLDFSTAINVMSQLHTDAGASTTYSLVAATVAPNAFVFAGAFLLGPGFAVGAHTFVTPTAVSLGPLPMFPLLAALPDNGSPDSWIGWLVVLGPLVALGATIRTLRRWPTSSWEDGAVRGCIGGVVAGTGFGLLAGVAGGSIGPGLMHQVGPFVSDVLVHAIATFGLAGLAGGLLATWWERRTSTGSDLDDTVIVTPAADSDITAGPA